MKYYGVRDVCETLGIKQHVLRYWESQITLVTPLRSDSGHRRWTSDQLRLLRRIRHLVVDRGMNVAAAEEQLLRESTGAVADRKSRIAAFRDTLESVRSELTPSQPSTEPSEAPSPWAAHLDPVELGMIPPPAATAEAAAAEDIPEGDRENGARRASPDDAAVTILVTAQHLDFRRVSEDPPELTRTPSGRTIISVTAARIKALPKPIPWVIATHRYGDVLDYLERNHWFDIPPSRITVLPVPEWYGAVAGRYRIGVPLAVAVETILNRSFRAWIGAHGGTALHFHRVLDAAVPLVDDAVVGAAMAGSVAVRTLRRRHFPLAMRLESGGCVSETVIRGGSWRRELNSDPGRAEILNSIWLYEFTPRGAQIITDPPLPADRIVPVPWSSRWPREFDLVAQDG